MIENRAKGFSLFFSYSKLNVVPAYSEMRFPPTNHPRGDLGSGNGVPESLNRSDLINRARIIDYLHLTGYILCISSMLSVYA